MWPKKTGHILWKKIFLFKSKVANIESAASGVSSAAQAKVEHVQAVPV